MSVTDLVKDVKNVVILNALPLNAFSAPVNLKIIPIDGNNVINIINTLKGKNIKCFIGHPPTVSLLATLGLNVNCTRAMWTYDNTTDLILAVVMKSRPATSGADVAVTLNDLLFYLVLPSPISP